MTLSLVSSTSRQIAIPGIIGGMGPLAHLQFEQLLLEQSCRRGANRDQDHPVWLLINAAPVPDRTQSLQGQAPDCTPWLVQYAQRLESAGADFLIVTCNTAHGFYGPVQAQVNLPWIPLMGCTTRLIVERYPSLRRVGILATDGTLQSGLYHHSLAQAQLQAIAPDIASPGQTAIMEAIYHPHWGIKATGLEVSPRALQGVQQGVTWLQQQGAEILIPGCTELSVALSRLAALPLPWIDPLEAVAAITLDLAYGQRSPQALLAA